MPYNGDLISFVIAPGGDFNIITYSGLNIWDIGVGCDFTLNFKLLDGLYITGAMNFVYYFYKGVSDSSIRSDNKSYTFAPRIGISIID